MYCRPGIRIGMLVIALVSASAMSLTPREVLVVANSNSPQSVSLARFYAAQRGIPERNLALVGTTTDYEVSRRDYELEIRRPIMQLLVDRRLVERIRCVVLMWGVPVRVAGGETAERTAVLLPPYKTAAERAHYRMGIDYEHLQMVGKKFPTSQPRSLRPVGALFEPRVQDQSTKPPDPDVLREKIDKLLEQKQQQVAEISDRSKRTIATKQLMGLHLDIRGLRGLREHITETAPSKVEVIQGMSAKLTRLRAHLDDLRKQTETPQNIEAILSAVDKLGGASLVHSYASARMQEIQPTDADASVDSELALLWWGNHRLSGFIPNILCWRQKARIVKGQKIPPVLMTSRIDGPTSSDARRIIEASVETEKTGLDGTFYIDAGVPPKFRNADRPAVYIEYDGKLQNLDGFLRSNTTLKVVTDRKGTVFPPKSCPRSALYVGWYSLRRYVPAFAWTRGAVGWHTASFEAMDLRNPNSKQWCPKMIQNGVAATIGAVNEPGLSGFPVPKEFFALLLAGKWTVGECYWRTVPLASWRMTLIADPLYNPFAANPKLDVSALPEGLAF